MFIEIKLRIRIRKPKNKSKNLIVKFRGFRINLRKLLKYRRIGGLEFSFLLIKLRLRRYINHF
jgi:hypothetical protein